MPAFRPIRRPPTQITKVTAAMISDQSCGVRHDQIIFRDRKAHGQCVDGSCDALDEQVLVRGASVLSGELFFICLSFLQSLQDHLPTDIEKEEQGDPGYKLPEL